MQYCWFNKNNNDKLILIFNGWGMDEAPFRHLKSDGYDVLILSDYRKIDIDLNCFDFEKYRQKYLMAWSMGVYISGLFKEALDKFDEKIAINGTGKIIDNAFGIPEKIYNATIKFFSEETKDKFVGNMFKGSKTNPKITISKDLEALKDELISIKNLKINNSVDFDRAIVSFYDIIVPARNQLAYWKSKAKTIEIQSAHCPFCDYGSFEEILCNWIRV